MNFKSTRAKVSVGYLIVFIVSFLSFYLVDDLAFARFLGLSAANFLDELYIILVIIGIYPAIKLDILIAGICVALTYSVLSFSQLSQWHQELGIYQGAFHLLARTALITVLPAMFVYSILVPLIYVFRRNH